MYVCVHVCSSKGCNHVCVCACMFQQRMYSQRAATFFCCFSASRIVPLYVHVGKRMYVCMYVCICIRTRFPQMHTVTYCAHTHTHIYTYMHRNIYIPFDIVLHYRCLEHMHIIHTRIHAHTKKRIPLYIDCLCKRPKHTHIAHLQFRALLISVRCLEHAHIPQIHT